MEFGGMVQSFIGH